MADEISEVEEFEWTEEKEYRFLKAYIMGENPNRIAILAACELAVWMPVIPDWVSALMGGNPELWDDVVEEVRHLIRFDEKKAQS